MRGPALALACGAMGKPEKPRTDAAATSQVIPEEAGGDVDARRLEGPARRLGRADDAAARAMSDAADAPDDTSGDR